MTVSELIKFLETQQPDMQVAFRIYSEYSLMEAGDISVVEACEPRPDGWIHWLRDDKPSQKYLMFPGN